MKLLFILLALPFSLFGQTIEYEKSDSIHLDNHAFPTYILKINNYSASDPAKVFVVPAKSLDSFKTQIPKLYFSRKQEYNEYYVLGVANLFQTETVKLLLTEFLNKIDSSRIARNRSTFLRLYTLDKINNKIIYQPTLRNLSEVDNLHYLNSTKDICKYMMCYYSY